MSEEIRIQTKPLSEMVVINNGIDYKKNPKGNEEIPIYGTGGIMGYTSIALNEGPAVLTGRKGSINRPFFLEGKFWNVDTIFCLKPIGANSAKWLYYSILNVDMTKLNEATGVPSITSKSLYRLKINYFEPDKQSEIAKILTTCDTVIEQTQSAIAKYKAIKQGLLHDLFTRGLDDNGKLRPTYQQAPELYKESELGMIPKEWEVKRLDEYNIDILDGDRGVNYPKSTDFFPDESCLFLSATNVTKNGFVFQNMQFITKEKDLILGTGKLQRNDIVLTTRGTVGNMAFYSEDIEYENLRINSGMLILRNNQNDINSTFLYLSIKEYIFGIEYGRVISGSAQPQLPIKDFRKFNLIKPEIEEQKEITKRLNAIDNKIQTEETLLQKYQSIKQGLMGDLLGGKKEVCNIRQ